MRLIQNAQTAADLSGSLIIMGVVAVLTFQIAVNVGMVIGFMPVTGIPLPLMSYGGSSVLFTFLALGAVDECPHAPVRKLGDDREEVHVLCIPEQARITKERDLSSS